jgi:hypothetical protein
MIVVSRRAECLDPLVDHAPLVDPSSERVRGMRSRSGLRGDQLGQRWRLIFLQEMFAG